MNLLTDYIYVKKDFLTKTFCDKTVNMLNAESNWDKHYFHKELDKTLNSYEYDPLVSRVQNKITEEIMDKLWFGLQDYLQQPFNTESKAPMDSWNGYSQIRFNRYDANSHMDYHADHIHTLFDGTRRGIPILSIVGLLNDDFEGGELEFFGDYKLPLTKGSLAIFPSSFLYPHGVLPIIKGVRYSFVSWVW
jgi:hypothetical protein